MRYKKGRFISLFLLSLCFLCAAFISSCERECTHEEFKTSPVPPTCDAEGYTLNSCVDCSFEYKTDIISPTGHTLSEETFAPLCEKEGYTYYFCSCGYEYKSDFVAPTGHTLRAEKHSPTCLYEGYTQYSCACGYEYKSDFSLPKGHVFTSEVSAPSCLKQGYTTHSCSACDYSYISDIVAPTNHSLKSEIVYPTSTLDGYVHTFCENNCGYEYETSPVRSSDVYKGAYVNNTEILAYGIDVSAWNGKINWTEIKEAGIDFVIIKAGSTNGKDSYFETNYAEAKAAGLDVGCYYYSYALTVDEILNDAKLFLEQIAGKQFEYPVFLDIEDTSQENLESKLLTEMCSAFIEKMQSS